MIQVHYSTICKKMQYDTGKSPAAVVDMEARSVSIFRYHHKRNRPPGWVVYTFSDTGEAAPVKNLVVSGVNAAAPTRDSLFFPWRSRFIAHWHSNPETQFFVSGNP